MHSPTLDFAAVFNGSPANDLLLSPDLTIVGALRASLARVPAHKRPDRMTVQKYDIRRPASAGGGFADHAGRHEGVE